MKKILTVLLALMMVLIMTGCEEEKSEKELAIEFMNGQDVDMSEYGVSNSDYFKKVTPEKLFELMEIKEGEKEYNLFIGKTGCADCEKAAKLCEKVAKELDTVIFYCDANDVADNEEFTNKYLEKFAYYTDDKFRVPFCVKVCDGIIAGYDFTDEYQNDLSDIRIKAVYEPLSEEYINEVIIPKANGTWEY